MSFHASYFDEIFLLFGDLIPLWKCITLRHHSPLGHTRTDIHTQFRFFSGFAQLWLTLNGRH